MRSVAEDGACVALSFNLYPGHDNSLIYVSPKILNSLPDLIFRPRLGDETRRHTSTSDQRYSLRLFRCPHFPFDTDSLSARDFSAQLPTRTKEERMSHVNWWSFIAYDLWSLFQRVAVEEIFFYGLLLSK